MTFRVKKRGSTYRLEGRYGERSKRDSGERERLRLSLGTSSGDAAQALLTKIDKALAGGPDSLLWSELRGVLPPETFDRLANSWPHPEASGASERGRISRRSSKRGRRSK